MEATFAADENKTLLNSSKVGRFSRELYHVVELQLSHVIWAINRTIHVHSLYSARLKIRKISHGPNNHNSLSSFHDGHTVRYD